MDLDLLERDVLRKLELLSEGGTMDLGRLNLHRAHPQGSPPPGFDRAQNGVLSSLVSLMGYHADLMSQARERGLSARLMAIANANADYDSTVKRKLAFNSFDAELNTEDRNTAILVHFEGCRPEWPAAYMGCSTSHVEKLRRRNGRDAILGERLDAPAFA